MAPDSMRAHAMDKTQFFSFIKLVFTSCERASIYENAGECNAGYTSHFTTRGCINGLYDGHIIAKNAKHFFAITISFSIKIYTGSFADMAPFFL
jgi:hypothetical protein